VNSARSSTPWPPCNEEADLPVRGRRLHSCLSAGFPYPFRTTVVDNASTDATLQRARRLAGELLDVRVVHLNPERAGAAR
jgi:glycosyltransferase involved in cell wall biosynthesis